MAGAQLHLPEDHEPTLEEMQTLFDRMSPAPAQLRNPRWLSRFACIIALRSNTTAEVGSSWWAMRRTLTAPREGRG